MTFKAGDLVERERCFDLGPEYGIALSSDTIFWANGLQEIIPPADMKRIGCLAENGFPELVYAWLAMQPATTRVNLADSLSALSRRP